MDAIEICPACAQRDALIALGIRRDHPYRWRPWITSTTLLYLCDRCEALVEVDVRHGSFTCATPQPSRLPAPCGAQPDAPRAA